MMRALFLIFIAIASAPAAAREASPYDRWVGAQIVRLQASNASEDAVLADIWKHMQCGDDAACDARVSESDLAKRAHTLAAGKPHLLASLANADIPSERPEIVLARWREIASADPHNLYPLAHVAALQWRLGQASRALESLALATTLPDVDDYYTAMYLTVKRSLDPHPPALDELEPCWDDGEPSGNSPSAIEREHSTISSLLGAVGFGPISDLFALCKATDTPLDERHQALCDDLGSRMSAQASTLLIKNVGLALRRSASTNPQVQALFTQAQRERSDAVVNGTWWMSAESSVREAAYLVWFDAFSAGGEVAAAKALSTKYGASPTTHEEHATRLQEQMKAGQACYAKLRHGTPSQPSP